jgi:hypothetical protein
VIRRYSDVLADPAYLETINHLGKTYEIRAGRAGAEIVCAVFLGGVYLDAFAFMAAEIEPSRGVGEDVLVRALMDDAKSRVTGHLSYS